MSNMANGMNNSSAAAVAADDKTRKWANINLERTHTHTLEICQARRSLKYLALY